MAQTLEMRVEDLEKKMAALESEPQNKKDWRRTVGIFKDDPDFEKAMRLGQEYRREQNLGSKIADS